MAFEAIGYDKAERFLKELDDKVSRRLLVSTLRKSVQPLVKAGRREAPVMNRAMKEFWGNQLVVEPGVLKRSVGVITAKKRSDKKVTLYVGPRKLKISARKKKIQAGKTNRNDAWFRHFVIRGTTGYLVKKGKNKGRFISGQKPNPFMDRAYTQTNGKINNGLKESLIKSVDSYCKRKGIAVR